MRRLAALALALLVGGAAPLSSSGPARATTTSAADASQVTGSVEAIRALIDDPAGPASVEIPSGVHRGDLVIRRPLTLRGAPGAILEGSGASTVLKIEASDVTVQDLTVRRSGRRSTTEDAAIKAKGERVRIMGVEIEDSLFGVVLNECKDCLLERANITGYDDLTELRGDGIKLWESHGSTVRQCNVNRSRDVVVWYTRHATLEGNTVRGSRYGSHFMYAHDAVVKSSRFESNVVGVFVMYSKRLQIVGNVMAGAHGAAGMGLGLKDSDTVDVRGNWLVANTAGTYLDNTPRTVDAPATFDGNVIALNDVGLRIHGAERGLHLHGNDLRDNGTLVEVDGGGDALHVDVRGNYFSDYEGYDLDGDGTGDVAHQVKTLSSEMTDAHPTLRFFHGTAAMAVIDAVAHAVPVLSAKTLLVDPAPLARRPHIGAAGP